LANEFHPSTTTYYIFFRFRSLAMAFLAKEVVVTGHSLGGGIALVVGALTDRLAVALQPPGGNIPGFFLGVLEGEASKNAVFFKGKTKFGDSKNSAFFLL
jgi:putative lipase involved disintegration of autophagic bodies